MYHLSHRYIFPGLALGAALGQTGVVTNAMINRSAEALVELISEDDLERRATFPENVDIREISCHLAAKVIEQALEEGLKVRKNECGKRLRCTSSINVINNVCRLLTTMLWRPLSKLVKKV